MSSDNASSMFEMKLHQVRDAEPKAYEGRMRACLCNGRADIEKGRYMEGIDAFSDAVRKKVVSRGD